MLHHSTVTDSVWGTLRVPLPHLPEWEERVSGYEISQRRIQNKMSVIILYKGEVEERNIILFSTMFIQEHGELELDVCCGFLRVHWIALSASSISSPPLKLDLVLATGIQTKWFKSLLSLVRKCIPQEPLFPGLGDLGGSLWYRERIKDVKGTCTDLMICPDLMEEINLSYVKFLRIFCHDNWGWLPW